MSLHLLSLDFRSTPIELREKLAFAERVLPDALRALQTRGASEAAILSTCNRVELFAQADEDWDAPDALLAFLCDWHRVGRDELEGHWRHLTDGEAARHLFRVTCGLESLVPGEMQILGQVRQAAALAREAGTLGPALDRLFTCTASTGRRARHQTGISRRPVSISHAAIALIKEHFGHDLNGRQVLLIGSGKMSEVAIQQLSRAGAAHFIVANRTLERACEVVRRWGGTALHLDEMPDVLGKVDAVISATSAPHLLIHPHHVHGALQARNGRPLLLVDLAVPRDIDPAVGELPGIILRDVDGLQAVVERNVAMRNDECEVVEGIIEEALGKFLSEQASRTVAPTITSLRRSAEEIRQAEVEKALERLNHLNEQERAVVVALSHGLVNKLLHTPTVRLREKATTPEGGQFRQAVEALFALDDGAA